MVKWDRVLYHRTVTSTRKYWCLPIVALLSFGLLVTAAAPASAAATRVFTGAPAGAPTIGLIGDSTLAGIRWTNSYGPLASVNYSFNAESCRRTIDLSCSGREGYAPPNALSILQSRSGQWGTVLVMVTGYNDAGYRFDDGVDAIMAEAARQGIDKVMWLTMRTADVSYVAPTYSSNAYTFRDNNRILLQKSVQYGGRLQIADWATYSADQPSWFYSDGVHYRTEGALQSAAYIAREATRVAAGWNITPGSQLRCAGQLVTHVGTSGNDTIVGSSGDDVVLGLDGDDDINTRDGDDIVCAGSGDDVVRGGDGHDVIYGHGGDDFLYGKAGDDVIWGGDGDDLLTGADGSDVLRGDDGDDQLLGHDGDDELWGGLGVDTASGGNGDDLLYGEDGDDLLYGGADTDVVWGGAGVNQCFDAEEEHECAPVP